MSGAWGWDRYGYQSVRAGSQMCTWASTTRVGRSVIGPPCPAAGPVAPDDLAERPVEPVGEGRATEGDAADRSGVAAQPEPSVADHQLRSGQGGRLGVVEQVGDELAGRPAGGVLGRLEAGGEGGDPALGGAGGDPGVLDGGLGPAAPSRGGRVGQGHQLDRAAGVGGVVGDRPGPSGIGVDALDDVPVLGQHLLPTVGRRGRRRSTGRGDDDGVDRTVRLRHGAQGARRRRRSRGRARPGGTGRTGPRGRRPATRPAAGGRTRRRTSAPCAGVGSAGLGRLVEDRPEAGVAATGAGLVGLGLGERRGDDLVEHPGEGDDRVGPHHLDEAGLVDDGHLRPAGEEHLAASTTRTPRRPGRRRTDPRSSGSATERKEMPPPPDWPAFRARSRAEAIIRVAAMGDMALTVTPGGAWRPSCQVRAAMARLAQL